MRISRDNIISLGANSATFICTFLASLIVAREIGSSQFYSKFVINSSYVATFIFLSGALKETILYCNKENPNFIYTLKASLRQNRFKVISVAILFFLVVFSLIFYFVQDHLISIILFAHISSFYVSEIIQFTSVLTDQVKEIIRFRLISSLIILSITWIALEYNFNHIIYLNLLFNTLFPLVMYLRLKQSENSKQQETNIINFDYSLFCIISFQYLISSFFIFLERYLLDNSAVDVNSYSISIGFIHNLTAIFLSYLTIEFYSKFLKAKHEESFIINLSIITLIIVFPVSLLGSLYNMPFLEKLFLSQNNSEIFISDISDSLSITIWAIPSLTVHTLISRYVMSVDKIHYFIYSSIYGAVCGICFILVVYWFLNDEYLRYGWMLAQNISFIMIFGFTFKKHISSIKIKLILGYIMVLTISNSGISFLFESVNLVHNSIELILSTTVSYFIVKTSLSKKFSESRI